MEHSKQSILNWLKLELHSAQTRLLKQQKQSAQQIIIGRTLLEIYRLHITIEYIETTPAATSVAAKITLDHTDRRSRTRPSALTKLEPAHHTTSSTTRVLQQTRQTPAHNTLNHADAPAASLQRSQHAASSPALEDRSSSSAASDAREASYTHHTS